MTTRSALARGMIDTLSEHELELLRCLVAGESQQAIASRLGLGDEEAVAVRQSLMRKLEADCTADAVREGIYAGL